METIVIKLDTFKQHKLFSILYPYINRYKTIEEYNQLIFILPEDDLLKVVEICNIYINNSIYDLFKDIIEVLYYYYNSYLTSPKLEGIRYGGVADKKYVVMYDDLAYLLRPIQNNMITYNDLKTGDIMMNDLKILNDYLDANEYNKYLTGENNG